MLKICQICSVLPPGGDAVGEAVLKLKLLLENDGVKCSILTSTNQAFYENTFRIFKNWGFINIIKSVVLLKKLQIDIVIFHYPSPYYGRNIFVTLIAFVYRITGIKIISFIHEYSNYKFLGKIRIVPLLIFSNRIITSDHLNYFEIIKVPNLKEKSTIIAVGSNFPDSLFNFDQYNALLPRLFFENGKTNLLYFGNIMQGKGLEILLKAFEDYPELNQKFNLHIAGNFPEAPNKKTIELKEKIQKSGFAIYHGYLTREQLAKLFSSINIVCLPYNQGVTIRRSSFMTSMGFAKFVITTKSKFEIADLEHMKNVYFIENLTSKDLKKVLISVSELNQDIQNEIGNKAKEWYFSNYSEEVYKNKILMVINSIKKNIN